MFDGIVFVGKDVLRVFGKIFIKVEDVSFEWQDFDEKEKFILDDWVMFFFKCYNVIGVVEGVINMV